MRQLRIALAALALQLLMFYGIERFNQDTNGALSLSPASYVIGILGVVLLIAFPAAAVRPLGVSAGALVAIYLGSRLLVFDDQPLLGGAYTYLTLTECVLITMVVALAHTVDRNVRQAEELVSAAGFSGYDGMFVPGGEQPQVIQREMTRSRRYSRSLSVVVVIPYLQQPVHDHRAPFREFSQWLIRRRAKNHLALLIREATRRNDLLFEWQGRDELIVLCPETDRQQINTVVRKIQTIADDAGMRVRYGSASFPDDALTFDELVVHASAQRAVEGQAYGVPTAPLSVNGADVLAEIESPQSLMTEHHRSSWSPPPYIVNEQTDDRSSGYSEHSQ